MKAKRALLVLEDGSIYYGWSFNTSLTSMGEVVFNTGMTGYQEVITDPSYSEQIINFTYPELGNTGINEEDMEANMPLIKGIIAKNICMRPSNWRQSMSLIDYLLQFNIMHIYGIDTRSITKHLRNSGTMNGCISSSYLDPKVLLQKFQEMSGRGKTDLVLRASTCKHYTLKVLLPYKPFYSTSNFDNISSQERLHLVVLDFGVKNNILRYLNRYVRQVTVVPANIHCKDILAYQPDGVLLSNGPGDPQDIHYAVQSVTELLKYNIPLFGICMGHQILSLALGLDSFKLKFGHRGLNHPVGLNKVISITSQNHGFGIQTNKLENTNMIINQFNYNDKTIAAISHRQYPYFAVQYHPEASPGPHDADSLFLHFIRVIKALQKKPEVT